MSFLFRTLCQPRRSPTIRKPCLRIGVEQLEDRSVPAIFTVTTPFDFGSDSLRHAIEEANDELAHPGPDTIIFSGTAAHGVIVLSDSGVDHLGPTALEVTSAITILGSGETLGTSVKRLFYVSDSGFLELRNLTLSGGQAQGVNVGGSDGGHGGGLGAGGAIYNQGTLVITNCTLTDNTAQGGNGGQGLEANFDGASGSFGIGGSAGAGTTTPGGAGGFGAGGGGGVDDSGGSGGLYAGDGGSAPFDPPLTLGGAGGGGGGAGLGGAIFNDDGVVAITNSTFAGNFAVGGQGGAGESGSGGFPGSSGLGAGGAIFSRRGRLILNSCTLTDNTGDRGRGIECNSDGGNPTVATINNTIIGQADTNATDYDGNASEDGFGNLIRTAVGFAGQIVSTANPLLGPLQDNGGPTWTCAPSALSPAINAGVNVVIPLGDTADQRGAPFGRIREGNVDIGAFESGNPPTAHGIFVVGADAGGPPLVQVFDSDSGKLKFTIMAYAPSFTGGVRVATGDVTGDGFPDIITVPGPGSAAFIKIFSGINGVRLSTLLAYPRSFTGGAYVAVGDVTGDGRPDIITGRGAGGSPLVHVFDVTRSNSPIRSFLAYPASFTGGVTVAAGDVTGDGRADIVTGRASNGIPQVKVFDLSVGITTIRSFLAYNSGMHAGVNVAAGDITGDGFADIITGPAAGPNANVRAFDGANQAIIRSFQALGRLAGSGGVRVAAFDQNHDDIADIIAAAGPGNPSRVRILHGLALIDLDSVFAFNPKFKRGLFVAGAN